MIKIIEPDDNRNYVTVTPSGDRRPLEIIESETVESLYKTHGAILFRDFYFNLEVLGNFIDQFCLKSVINESGGRRIVDEKRSFQTVNLGLDAFPLHPELSRTPWKPDVCWFACAKPPATRGETTICDGVQVVKNMSPGLFKTLSNQRLRYTRIATPQDCETWLHSANPDDQLLSNPPAPNPFEYFREDGQIYWSFTRPMLHKPMFKDELSFGNFLIFSRLYNKDRHFPVYENGDEVPDELIGEVNRLCQEITVPVRWAKNDILMLDNSRFMHGRNSIENFKDRLIISRFGYLTFALPDAEEIPNAPWRNNSAHNPQPIWP
jgi:alpha-ketoglutarate-dependent taurine dioxygenase